MDDAAHLRGVFLRKDRQHLVVRVPVVDDHGEAAPAARADLFAEGGALGVPGGAVTVEIEPPFPRSPPPCRIARRLEAGEERVGEPPRVVRVQADDGVDARVPVGDRCARSPLSGSMPTVAIRVTPASRARRTTASSASQSGERSRCAWVSKNIRWGRERAAQVSILGKTMHAFGRGRPPRALPTRRPGRSARFPGSAPGNEGFPQLCAAVGVNGAISSAATRDASRAL